MPAPWDWSGFLRESGGPHVGRVICQRCGQRWQLPKCYLNRPTVQTVLVLQNHQRNCQLPASEQLGG